MRAESLELCPTPCDPMDHSPLGLSVHVILQARTLEWVAISFENLQMCLALCVLQPKHTLSHLMGS